MADWLHICKDGRALLLPADEQCDRCGLDRPRWDELSAAFEASHGYYPDPNSDEDAEDFPAFAGVQACDGRTLDRRS